MPKKQTTALLITFLLIDVLSIGAFVFLFNYTTNQIAETVQIEDNLKSELKKNDTIALMKQDLFLGKMYQDKLMNYVIPSGGTVDFIKTLELLVANSGLKSNIQTVSDQPYDAGNSLGMDNIVVDMSVVGEWKNIQFFIKSLENYPLKIDITKINLNKFSDYTVKGKDVPQWSCSLELTVVKVKDTK